jgi:hypothetical protein
MTSDPITSASPPRAAERARQALSTCRQPANLRRTLRIALVVGILLTLINQLDVIVEGKATTLTWLKVGLNFCVPFVVSNLGVLTGTRTAAA